MPARKLRLALCQLNSTPDIKANVQKLEDSVAWAESEKADIVIFPEYYVQGIVAESPEKVFDDGGMQEKVSVLAKKHSVDIVVGTLVENMKQASDHPSNPREQKTFNTAYYFGSDGKVLGKYTKRNLWHPEKDYLHPGEDDHLVFNTAHCRTGMLICWDLAWPEAFRALMIQGVDLIIVPTYWVADDLTDEGRKHDPEAKNEISWLDSLVISRAYENECIVAFVNCGGPAEKGFLGRSAVAAPLRGCLGRIDGPEEARKVVEVDLDVLPDARNVYQIKKDYRLAKAKNFGHPIVDDDKQ